MAATSDGSAAVAGGLADLRHLQRLTIVADTEHEMHGISDVPGLHDVELVYQPQPVVLHRLPVGVDRHVDA